MTKLLLWCILLCLFWPVALVIAALYACYWSVMVVVWLYMAAFKGTYITIMGLGELKEWAERRNAQATPKNAQVGRNDAPDATGVAYQLDDLHQRLRETR